MSSISREFELTAEGRICCSLDCKGRCAFTNNNNQEVCGALGAPTKTKETVGRFTNIEEMLVCGRTPASKKLLSRNDNRETLV